MMLSETIVRDLRYGVRILARQRGFTAVAVLALALGIGVNTSVFTAYKALVARPLDARTPAELVNLALMRQSGAADFNFSYPDYAAYRDSARSFQGLIAFGTEHLALAEPGGTEPHDSTAGSTFGTLAPLVPKARNAELATVFAVSENYFHVLGVPAFRGLTFDTIRLSELAASPAVLISENYWERRFGGDPSILGKTVRLNGTAVTIAGITPHDFTGTSIFVPDFWLPLSLEPLIHGDGKWLTDWEKGRYRMFGRLASGVTLGQARAEMNLLASHVRLLHDPHADASKPVIALVWPGSPFPLPLRLYPGLIPVILLVMAAAAMVLIVACANVGSLQLARARSRQNELRTRLSLGASRQRVIRQLLTESALLSLLAGAMALFLSYALLRIGATQAAGALPTGFGTLVFHVTPDQQVFAYVLCISLAASLLFGLAPAMESSSQALSAATRGSTSPARSRRLQDILIAAQVALSLVLMIAGSMFIRSSVRALRLETGYETKHVVDLNFPFPEASRNTPARKLAVVHEIRSRVAALPGVASVTVAQPPGQNNLPTAAAALNGQGAAEGAQSEVYYTYVEPNYFQTMSIPLSLGPGFSSPDAPSDRSVVISESAARKLWPGENPVGHSLRVGLVDERVHNSNELIANGAAYQVIGVAGDTRGAAFDGSDTSQIYIPLPEDKVVGRPMLIRTQSEAGPVIRALDGVVGLVDPNLVTTSSTLEDQQRQSAPFVVSSMAAAVASTVGLLGLLLASMGIYGTVNYIVVMRTREVGIRMAVGAQERDIIGLILTDSARPVLAGLAAGILLAAGSSILLRRMLYGLHGVDSASFAIVSVLFLLIALLAAYPPSRRALQVDPVVALRCD